MMARPAAPAPLITTESCPSVVESTRVALIRAARRTIAVPCWSSCSTGMPISCRPSSISKQRGAEMSSRLMPPNVGAMARTMSMISRGS